MTLRAALLAHLRVMETGTAGEADDAAEAMIALIEDWRAENGYVTPGRLG